MAISKVTLNGETLMDVTQDTVATNNLLTGETATGADGEPVVGAYSPPASVSVEPLNVSANGTYTAPSGKAYSPVTVNVSGGGETTASQKDVNFIDYDGTIRYSYTASEFANLTALPANPSHSGLTSQGWNWSLADAKAYVAKYGKLWIGQMYITDDGKTRVYIHLEEGRTSPMLGCCPNGTVVVDWGDGSATETLTGTSLSTVKWTSTHNYAAGGYVITLNVTSGTVALSGRGSSNQYAYLLRYSSDADGRNAGYQNAIQRIEIGENISIGNYAFYYCYSLASITIPDGVTSIGTNTFQSCYSLAYVVIPDSVTSIGTYAFYSCYSLANITIPNGVTSIGGTAFYYCYSLASITIPDGVTSVENYTFQECHSLASITIPDSMTSIGTNTFQNCYSLANITIPYNVTSISTQTFRNCYALAKILFKPATPPTVANSNAWSNIPTDCVISVPTGTLSAYTSATNYPDPATYTYIEED